VSEIAVAKTVALANLLESRFGRPERVLVVGCGKSAEAAILAERFGASVFATDIDQGALFAQPSMCHAAAMDGAALGFPDGTFDLVYSFHALEHMPSPTTALAELSRVAREGGSFLVGTPNEQRLVGYLGSDESRLSKVRWNVLDFSMRIRGRWSNESGAHAGFRASVLASMCRNTFGTAEDLSADYYQSLYPTHASQLRWLETTRFSTHFYPCVYVAGRVTHRPVHT
jgi:SAM-dependent methyltransferase